MGSLKQMYPYAFFSTKEEMGETETPPFVLSVPDPVTGNIHIAPYRDYLTLSVIFSYERFSAAFTTC